MVPSLWWWFRSFRSDCQYENFSFFKKGLAGWIIHTIVSAKLFLSCAGALSCRCSVSQSTFPGHFPPHIYHLKATERVKKTKPFFHFFCLFDFFPTAHSLSAFFSVLHRQIHQASACHSFIDYCLATYFSPVASDTLCPLLSPLPLVNFYNLFPGLSILIRTEDLDPLLPIHPLPSWAPNSLSGTPIRLRRVRAVLVLILALIPPAPRLIG